VSWGLRIAGDALADLKALDIWLQEEGLDELELLCANPPSPRPGAREPSIVHDFERTAAHVRHVVFIRLLRNDSTSTLSVVAIADSPRPPRPNAGS
jgi:hypothetical protein